MSIKHQDIIDAVKTRFEGITQANGYYTDLGSNCHVNKSNKLIASADETAINIVDVSASVERAVDQGMAGKFTKFLILEISLHFKDGTADTDIRKGIWDVEKSIGTDVGWGGLAINSYPPPGADFFQLIFEQEENIIVGAKIYLIIEFRETQWHQDEDLPFPGES